MLWLLSCREIQHIRDFEGPECEKHNHRRTGQWTQLGARLHVVSPSYFLLSSDLFFKDISVTLSSCCFFMSLFCCGSIVSCTRYGQCCISLNRNTFTLIIFVLIRVLLSCDIPAAFSKTGESHLLKCFSLVAQHT